MDFGLLKKPPFNLNESSMNWVKETWEAMSEEEKIGQIFCPISGETDSEKIQDFVDEFHPGGVLYRPMPAKTIQSVHRAFQNYS